MNYYRKIILAIEDFKNDVKKAPVFFTQDDLDYVETEVAIEYINKKLNQNEYKVSHYANYKIPYDTIHDRNAIAFDINDLIIRYVVMNEIKLSGESIFSNNFKVENFDIVCNIDIYDCYANIDVNRLVQIVSNIDNNTRSIFKNLLNFSDDCEKTFIPIGSKPDEYFAEIYLSTILKIVTAKVSENITRINDEFIIFCNSIGELRKIIKDINYYLADYNLEINKSKTKIKYLSENRIQTRLIQHEEKWMYSSPSCPAPEAPEKTFTMHEYSTKYFENVKVVDIDETKVVNSYDEAFKFVEYLNKHLKVLINYEENSIYNLFGIWDSSTPAETKTLYNEINFKVIINPIILENLEKIIYRFPRSQYYSALAVHCLITYAKHFEYSDQHSCEKSESQAFVVDNINFTELNAENASFLLEKSLSIILNSLHSENIHTYQKYLILRELFFNPQNMTIKLSNFKIKGNDIPFIVEITAYLNYVMSISNREEDDDDFDWDKAQSVGMPLFQIVNQLLKDN